MNRSTPNQIRRLRRCEEKYIYTVNIKLLTKLELVNMYSRWKIQKTFKQEIFRSERMNKKLVAKTYSSFVRNTNITI